MSELVELRRDSWPLFNKDGACWKLSWSFPPYQYLNVLQKELIANGFSYSIGYKTMTIDNGAMAFLILVEIVNVGE